MCGSCGENVVLNLNIVHYSIALNPKSRPIKTIHKYFSCIFYAIFFFFLRTIFLPHNRYHEFNNPDPNCCACPEANCVFIEEYPKEQSPSCVNEKRNVTLYYLCLKPVELSLTCFRTQE